MTAANLAAAPAGRAKAIGAPRITPGTGAPLGATVGPGGVNFSVYAKSTESIELLLFDDVRATKPTHVIALDPRAHCSYHYWHVFVPNLRAGQVCIDTALPSPDDIRLWSKAAAVTTASYLVAPRSVAVFALGLQ